MLASRGKARVCITSDKAAGEAKTTNPTVCAPSGPKPSNYKPAMAAVMPPLRPTPRLQPRLLLLLSPSVPPGAET